ncbi:MAG: TetR/AcrR family transcriptional regulator [Arachnia sp.]
MTRAAPLPRAERRAAIIEATLPLIHEAGTSITTRQVAEASGVAEGTIFRVFDSLKDLIDATILEAFSEHRLTEALAATDLGETIESTTAGAIELIVHRITTTRSLLMAAHGAPPGPHRPSTCLRDELEARRHQLDAWIVEALRPHADELAIPLSDFVVYLGMLATGNAMRFGDTPRADASALATFALHGALRKDLP